MSTVLKRVAFLVIIIILWEAVFRIGFWPEFLFPSPTMVLKTLLEGFLEGGFFLAILHSLRRLLIGYGISLLIGMSVGVLIASSKLVDDMFGGFIVSLQSVPSVVWLPLALLWFKLGDTSIIFVVVLGGVWNMILSTSTGIKNVEPVLKKCGKNLGYKGIKLFIKVIIPASVPHIITGMRLSWAFCWRALMAAEVLGTGKGLGQILMWGRDMGNMSTVLSVMVIIAFTGFITDNLIFKRIEQKVMKRWGLLGNE